MAFPYGGSMTHAELAEKFGWPSVILSILLLPFSLLWSRIIAFPVWLNYFFESKPKYTIENILTYPCKHNDLFRKKFYESPQKKTTGLVSGWNCHVDEEGGKFFESFFGIINCLDIEVNEERFVITPNSLSWLSLSKVFVEFDEGPRGTYGHRVRFYFPLDGPNFYNPFTWGTIAFTAVAMTWFSKRSFKEFKEKYDVKTKSAYFPAEPEGKKRNDESVQYKIEVPSAINHFFRYAQPLLHQSFMVTE